MQLVEEEENPYEPSTGGIDKVHVGRRNPICPRQHVLKYIGEPQCHLHSRHR
jgi:hypothetical protein